MKNGFRYDGFEAEAGGGSFGQRSGELQYGVQSGNFGVYIAGHIYGSNGWRQFSPDTARQLYAAVSYHHDRVTLDVSFSGASNNLDGEGTTPVQSLAVNRSLDFTTPQNNINRVTVVDANAGFQVTDELSMQVNAYRREFHQHAINGNTTNYRACASGNGLLCQADGATEVTAANGLSIPDISLGGAVPIGEEDRETIHAVTMGGAAQSAGPLGIAWSDVSARGARNIRAVCSKRCSMSRTR
jgi:iron complex outermembrane receptor protein